MKRLCDELNVDKSIKKVNATSIEDAIIKTYSCNEYNFYLNSELIDVNNRFRIFNFNGIDYICKKSNLKDTKNEIKLASKAQSLIDNTKVDNYTVKVIMPKVFEIDGDCYIVTEFKGDSLQELSYHNANTKLFTEETLFNILDRLMKVGIVYRGFLPRNTILKDNVIYLLDWEDTILFPNVNETGINILWLTNFLLNWSYLYDASILKNKIKTSNITFKEEPDLLKYEIKFASWAKLSLHKKRLRKKIIDTVLFAEKKLSHNYKEEFAIMPNGMAHLVSDLFNSDIDVLFDISSFVIRQNNEEKYYEAIRFLSSLIIKQYYDHKNIHKYALIIILMIFELASKENINSITIPKKFISEDEFINNKSIMSFKLVKEYLYKSHKSFEKQLEITIGNLIKNYNGTTVKTENISDLANYLLSFKEED
ncbi:MAG: hypothetical protein IJL74_01705 [Bacilli bacterium]|nr:hypothetical protein [Bacilli bacterium]